MRLKKAKLKDDQLEVTYTERLEDGTSKITSETYTRKAHPDLNQSLQNLAIHWAILCGYVSVKQVKNIETPKPELVEGIDISGISIKTGDDEGVVITGYKKLETGKAVNINTPFQRYTETEESAYKFTDDLMEKVERANKEVAAYLDGSKKAADPQQSLGFPEGGEQKPPQNRLPEDIESEDVTDPDPNHGDETIWENGVRPKV